MAPRQPVPATGGAGYIGSHMVRMLRADGDPATLVASNRKVREVLGWRPLHDALDSIVRTSWLSEQRRQACGGPEAIGASHPATLIAALEAR
jgi:UDP-glucose 4-epimerase